jgi:hypothetical protein
MFSNETFKTIPVEDWNSCSISAVTTICSPSANRLLKVLLLKILDKAFRLFNLEVAALKDLKLTPLFMGLEGR